MPARVGVLALQGAFHAHAEILRSLGCEVLEVRTPRDLEPVDALVMPGGESSTMSQLLESSGLFDELAVRMRESFPVFGTCAGLILLARDIVDGRDDQKCFGALDVTVRRNAFGRQVDSFEAEVDTCLDGERGSMHGVFIRAPRIERVGPDVEVLARLKDEPVLVRQGSVLGASFHPELSGDALLHEYFVSIACARKG